MRRHVAFFEPATAYRKPSICDMHGLVVDVVAACGPVVRDELERLMREQAAGAANETTAEALAGDGGNEGQGGPTT